MVDVSFTFTETLPSTVCAIIAIWHNRSKNKNNTFFIIVLLKLNDDQLIVNLAILLVHCRHKKDVRFVLVTYLTLQAVELASI